jgi:hypothetical protein
LQSWVQNRPAGLKLATSLKKLADCPPLTEPEFTEKRAALEAIMIEAPAIGKE